MSRKKRNTQNEPSVTDVEHPHSADESVSFGNFVDKCADLNRCMCHTFMRLQEESITVQQGVKLFQKLYDNVHKFYATKFKIHIGDANGEEDLEVHRNNTIDKYFFNAMIYCLKLPLSYEDETAEVKRILDVICYFVVSLNQTINNKLNKEANTDDDDEDEEEMNPFMRMMLLWLLDHHSIEASHSRYRICLMINLILKVMPNDASIDAELYDKIYHNMLIRLKDKVDDVRCQAVTVLQRLQDPSDRDCVIMKAYVFHMSCDVSATVRRNVIECLAASKAILPHILDSLRDVDEKTRLAAYKFITDKVHYKSFVISKLELILRLGLSDRSETVRAFVEKSLIPKWLSLCSKKVVDLLYAVDIINCEDKATVDGVFMALFKHLDTIPGYLVKQFPYLDETRKVVPHGKLTVEVALFWKYLSKYLYNKMSSSRGSVAANYEEQLSSVLPETLTDFCDYIRSFVFTANSQSNELTDNDEAEDDSGNIDKQDVLCQLVEMANFFDLSDEVGRNNLRLLCVDLLKCDVSLCEIHVVESLCKLFVRIRGDGNRISDFLDPLLLEMAEIISELRHPLIMSNGDSDQIDEDNLLLQSQNMKENNNEVEITQNPSTIIKCLEVIYRTLQNVPIHPLNGTLITLIDEFIIPNISNAANGKVRKASLQALVVLCFRRVELARQYLFLLFQIAHVDDLDVRKTAVRSIVDLLRWHKISSFISASTNVSELVLNETWRGDVTYNGWDFDPSKVDTSIMSFGRKNTEALGDLSILDTQNWTFNMGGGGCLSRTSTQVENLGGSCGSNDLNARGSGSDNRHIILYVLLSLMEEKSCPPMQTEAAEGLCKLFIANQIRSPIIFQRLIVIWYSPETESNSKLKKILGTFFPLYASINSENQRCIGEAFIGTFRALKRCPNLYDINLDNVAQFFSQLTHQSFLQVKKGKKKGSEDEIINVHDLLSLNVIKEICDHPSSFVVRPFAKFLLTLNLTPDNFKNLRKLKSNVAKVLTLVLQKQDLNRLMKFESAISEMLKKDDEIQCSISCSTQESIPSIAISSPSADSSQDESSLNQTKRRLLNPSSTLAGLASSTALDTPALAAERKVRRDGKHNSNRVLSSESPPLSNGKMHDNKLSANNNCSGVLSGESPSPRGKVALTLQEVTVINESSAVESSEDGEEEGLSQIENSDDNTQSATATRRRSLRVRKNQDLSSVSSSSESVSSSSKSNNRTTSKQKAKKSKNDVCNSSIISSGSRTRSRSSSKR